MGFGEAEVISLKQRPDQLGVTPDELVEHLAVVDVMAPLGDHRRWGVVEQLILLDRLDHYLLVEGLHRRIVVIVRESCT